MRPRAAPQCILGLQVRLGRGLEQREVWGPGQGVRQVLDWELQREHQPPILLRTPQGQVALGPRDGGPRSAQGQQQSGLRGL